MPKKIAVCFAAILLGIILACVFVYVVPAVAPPLIYEQF